MSQFSLICAALQMKLKFSRVPDDVWIVDLDSAQVGFQSHSTQILLLNICHNKWKMILSSRKHFRCCTLIWKHCRLWWKRGKCGSFALDAILSDDHFQLTPPSDPRQGFSIPPLPEPEGNTLRAHLKQVESRNNIFFYNLGVTCSFCFWGLETIFHLECKFAS